MSLCLVLFRYTVLFDESAVHNTFDDFSALRSHAILSVLHVAGDVEGLAVVVQLAWCWSYCAARARHHRHIQDGISGPALCDAVFLWSVSCLVERT